MKQILPLIACAAALCVPADALDLVLSHRATGVLVLAQGATEQEQWAADQIVHYVRKMTGAQLQIRTELPPDDLPALFIGEIGRILVPDARAQLDDVRPRLTNDSFLLHFAGNRGALIGASPEAVCFAASELLESLGVRWYLPGDIGEVVPRVADIRLRDSSRIYRPDCDLRNIWYAPRDWARHRKLSNGGLVHGHSWERWIGDERKEDETLRGMQGGERRRGVCYTNPRVAEIFLRNIVKHIAETGATMVSLCPDDTPVRCECPECARIGTRDMNPFTGELAATDQVMYLFGKVIPAVLEEYPNTLFTFYAYWDCISPPKRYPVHPSLIVLAAPLFECPLHATTSAVCERRKWFRQCVSSWARQAKRLYIYDYDPPISWHGVMAPRMQLIADDAAFFRSIGVSGYTIEARENSFAAQGLDYYLYSRLMWSGSADVPALIDDFCEGLYMEAAAPMKQFWTRLAAEMAALSGALSSHQDINIHRLYTPKLMADLDALLRRAQTRAVRSDVKRRLEVARLVQEQTQAWLDSRRAAESADFIGAAAAIERMYQVKRALHEISPELDDPQRPDMVSDSPNQLRGIQARYRELARLCGQEGDQARLVALTGPRWLFRFDALNQGIYENWHNPSPPFAGWTTINTTEPWDYAGYAPDKEGIGWYATKVTLGPEWSGYPVLLYLPQVWGEDISIWVNGIEAMLPQGRRRNGGSLEVEIGSALKYDGSENVIAMRIFKQYGWGGPTAHVFVYSPTGGGATAAATGDEGHSDGQG